VFTSDEQAVAVTLWIFNTWTYPAFDTTPYLSVTSPEKQSGKTRLLEVISLLGHAPVQAANLSPAAAFRVIESRLPTLLIDEVDAIFSTKRGDERAEELRGIINSGYQSTGSVLRVVGRNHEVTAFSTYCPKALGGIGELPDTIADRSIPIRMERKPRSKVVERFRIRFVRPEGAKVTAAIRLHVDDTLLETLSKANPTIPDSLSDRAADIWEPLLAVAEEASDDWAERARKASEKLSTARTDEDDTDGVRLLSDLRGTWVTSEKKASTAVILGRLARIEEAPWASWYGRGLDARDLAGFLKPYGVKSKQVKYHGSNVRGYDRDDLVRPWSRYLLPANQDSDSDPGGGSDTSDTSDTTVTGQGFPSATPSATSVLPDPLDGRGSTRVAHEVADRNADTARVVAQVSKVAHTPPKNVEGNGSSEPKPTLLDHHRCRHDDGCERRAVAAGYCSDHFRQQRQKETI
jgi:hypothetical protein